MRSRGMRSSRRSRERSRNSLTHLYVGAQSGGRHGVTVMKPGERYWAFIEPFADDVSIFDGPEIFLRQFVRIPERARNLLAAHWCVAEVSNGGFHQFFFNSTGVLAPEAAAALNAMGLPLLGRLVATAMAVLGSDYPRDQDERQDRLDALCPDDEDSPAKFESMNEEFYQLLATEGGGWESAADSYAARIH
jgi:Domain of unknown function (DUF4375)